MAIHSYRDWKRILITGAAGSLGAHLRTELRGSAPVIRVSDLRQMPPAGDGEEVIYCDLADFEAVKQMMVGVDAVLHFGGIPVEDSWDNILQANIRGAYHVWEAARLAGVQRIVFASSNHAIGMYRRTERIDTDAPPRPDTFYGLSKAFGETLARMYFDKHGIEAACLRIGSCFPKPSDERMLATWLSYADMARLCKRCIEAPIIGCMVVYGVSDNDRSWWDNRKVDFLGYRPKDSAESFAPEILSASPFKNPGDPAVMYHGGHFVPPGYTR